MNRDLEGKLLDTRIKGKLTPGFLFLKKSRENPRISGRPGQRHKKSGVDRGRKKGTGETLTAC